MKLFNRNQSTGGEVADEKVNDAENIGMQIINNRDRNKR